MRKLGRAPDGSLIAAAGATIACAALLDWAESGMDGKPDIPGDDISALIVRPDGSVHLLGSAGTQARIDGPYHAEGTGYQLALGAMAAGASAEEAVRIACQYDGKSRGPVQTLRLEPAPSAPRPLADTCAVCTPGACPRVPECPHAKLDPIQQAQQWS